MVHLSSILLMKLSKYHVDTVSNMKYLSLSLFYLDIFWRERFELFCRLILLLQLLLVSVRRISFGFVS